MNSKIILIILLSVNFFTQISAQVVDWYKLIGSPDRDAPWDILVDRSGDLVLTGFYEGGPAFIDNNALTFRDGSEFFLAKMDDEGQLKWVQDFSGLGFDRGDKLVIDHANRIYLGGLLSDSLFISSAPDSTLISSGANDVFLMMFDDDGNLQWTKTFGGPSSDICYGLHVDDNELLVTGHFNDTMTSGLDGMVLPSAGLQDIYLGSFDTTGQINWVKRYGGTGHDRGYEVTKDISGNILLTGYFSDTIVFDGITLVSANGFDAFICKTDPGGNTIWAHSFPSPAGTDQSTQFAMDPAGNIYVVGYFVDSIDFLGNLFYEQSGSFQAYVVAVDPSGTFLWARTTEGLEDNFFWDIEYADEKLLLVGTASDGLKWGGQTFLSGDLARGLVSVLDLHGQVLQTHLFGSSPSGALRFFEGAWGIDEQIFVTGMVDDGVFFAGDNIATQGRADLIVGRISLSGTTAVSDPDRHSEFHSSAYYDPLSQSLKFTTNSQRPVNYLLSSIDGRRLLAGSFEVRLDISMEEFRAGLYFITFTEGRNIYSQKIIHHP